METLTLTIRKNPNLKPRQTLIGMIALNVENVKI